MKKPAPAGAEPSATANKSGGREWSGFSPGFVYAWVAWLAALFVLIELNLPAGLKHLLPGVENAFLFLLCGAALFLGLVAPAFWKPATGRLAALRSLAAQALLVAGSLVFAAAVASRLQPVTVAAVGRGGTVLLGFLAFSYFLFRLSERAYFLVQALLAAGGPWAAFLLDEMALTMRGESRGYPALKAASVFAGLGDAVSASARTAAIPGWALTTLIFVLGAGVCLALGKAPPTPPPESSANA